jgi:hypothetical protein
VILWCKSTLGNTFCNSFPEEDFRVTMNSWGQWAPTLFIVTLNPVVTQLIVQECQAYRLWDTKTVSYEVQPTNSHNEQKGHREVQKCQKRQENMYLI